MDMMLLGETVYATGDSDVYRGFWMPAGGNDGVAGVEVFRVSGASFTIMMETKKSDQADSSVSGNIGSAVIAAAGVIKFDVANAQDLVRYVIESEGSASMHLQLAQPLWAPN